MGKNKSKAARQPVNTQQALEKQYPVVDPSLIAALVAEIDSSQQKQLEQLHKTLASLCAPDDVQSLSSGMDQLSLTSSGSSFNDSFSSPTSEATTSSLASFSTPLGFLQNSFPHIQSSALQAALEEHGADNLDVIVDTLLSNDLIREMQERGEWSDAIDRSLDLDSVEEWTKSSKVPTPPSPVRPKAKKAKQTLIMGDVRQRLLPRTAPAPLVDPWTYIDSVATRLGSILPNVPATVFSSALHNPAYSTPATAIRSTLASLGNTHTVDDFALAALVTLLDATPDEIPDAHLCLRATASQPDDAFHLIEILKEVDEKVPVVAHYGPTRVLSPKKNVPSAPPDIPPARRKSVAAVASPVKSAWGTVPPSPVRSKTMAGAVPGSTGWKTIARVNPVEHHTGIDERDPDACMEEAAYWKGKQHEALKQASELYSRHKHEFGGEAALFYSNQAKDYATKGREWKLKAAKASVRARQSQTSSDAIDLHGLTVHESLEIVKESVNTWWSSAGSSSTPNTPLQIITGQGRHSKGSVPVIGPAVMKQLERDGWRVHKREGTVYVTGLKR